MRSLSYCDETADVTVGILPWNVAFARLVTSGMVTTWRIPTRSLGMALGGDAQDRTLVIGPD